MEWYQAGGLMLGIVLAMMALGTHVAYAFMIANMVGVVVFMGGLIGIEQLIANTSDGLTTFILVAVPLFLLMGNLFFHTGIAIQVFDTLDKLFGRVRGRLAYVTVSGGTLFAALSGSSMANTAMMGSLMVPEMSRRGYKRYMSIGPVIGSGGLAILIPPSALGVLLGSLAQINIGQLLIGGILPGLVLASLYATLIFLQVKFDPAAAPQYEVERVAWSTKLRLIVVNILPMGVVIFAVIGLIILGFATPSESAAFGVLGVLVLVVAYRRFSWRLIFKSLEGALRITVMVFFIILASKTFSQVLAFSGATSGMIAWATSYDLSPLVMLLFMYAVLLVLGMIVDQVSIMMLTLPIFMPLALTIGFDPVWFGIVILLAIEMSSTTPPFGLGLFVMMGVAPKGTTFPEVVRAALPFLGCDLVLFILLIVFPPLALYLPSLMRT